MGTDLDTKDNQENGSVATDNEKSLSNDLEIEEAQEKKIPYPKSVIFILSNEFCERFSYYGMRTILSLYLRDILLFSESDSTVIYHLFTVFAYFFPVFGAILSDSYLGRFRTILYVSMIYATGNILLALASAGPLKIPQVPFSLVALFLIALGTGGIKPCVSAFGGDQFVVPQQEKQLAAFFSVYYFAINAGSLISTFLTPVLREDVKCFGENSCFPLAFAVPGALMIVSIVIFFLGLPLYKIKKPEGNIVVQVVKCIWYGAKKNFKSKEKLDHWLDNSVPKFSKELVNDIKITLKVLVVFTPLPIFWALYDQQGSGWTFQASRMDGTIGSYTILPDQMQVINPVLILAFIPLFTYGVYPLFAKCHVLQSPLQRMICGGLLAALAFGISAGISAALEATYPTLPEQGKVQIRFYNPDEKEVQISVGNVNKPVKPMGFEYLNIETDNQVFFTFDDKNFTLNQGKGYFIYKNIDKALEDDISKPEDGLPKIRTITNLKSNATNITYIKDSKETAIAAANNSIISLDPGTYQIGNKDVEFQMGGVYTVLVFFQNNEIKKVIPYTITEPNSIHILWLIPQYIIITAAEILFSITGIEFSYSEAPATMKSVLQACFLLTSAFGNLIIVIIESAKFFDRQSLDFTLYAGLMVLDMILFAFIASKYKYKSKEVENENKQEKK